MHGRTRALGWIIGLTLTATANAQRWGGPTLYNRASNPSQSLGLVGRVGGYATGGNESMDPFRRSRMGSVVDDLSSPAGLTPSGQASFQRNRFIPSSAVWQRPRVGARLYTAPIRPVAPSRAELNAMSGFSQMVNPYRRMDTPYTSEPRAYTSPILPREYPSTYHQFFDLVPATDDEAAVGAAQAAAAQEVPNINEIINRRLESDLEIRRAAAITAFRDLMTEGIPERAARLDGLRRQLDDLRRASPDDYVPRLLLAHVAFEREQTATALAYLSEAVRCYPDIFVKKVDIGAFFGSRAIYERQLRRYVQAGSAPNAEPEAIAVEAYCALMLGDLHRANLASERAANAQRAKSYLVPQTRNDVEVIVTAIQAAVAGS
jgi:hypothetical protein